MATYRKHIAENRMVADCVGLIKGFFWTSNGTTASKYATNGCPDKSANGFFALCKENGPIATVPTTPGLALWCDGHIGISIDGVWAVEARGFNYGVVKTRIKDRKWTKWGKLPASLLDYVDGNAIPAVEPVQPVDGYDCPYAEPDRIQKKGSKGDGVRWVQWMLVKHGYDVGKTGIDGDFGSATDAAVKQFQKQNALEVDGEVGKLTRAALKSFPEATAETDEAADTAGDDPEDAEDAQSETVQEEPSAETIEHEPAEPYEIKGKIADLSKWQGAINWSAAARELDFCILRAQYGHEKQDERYLEYAKGCEEHGIPYGAYSYCLFDDVETAQEEAELFMERIAGTHPLFLVLDLEPGGVKLQDIHKEVSAYIARLRELGVRRIGLYIAHHGYKGYAIHVDEADFVWIPRYGKNSGEPETKPSYPCDLWQFTSNGQLGGVHGRVDLNQLMDETRMAWFRGEE